MFIGDDSWPGGGYYIVSFDVYNDVPTIFCVASFDSNGQIVEQELIDGYSGGMTDEMVSAFIHFGDLFNGKMIGGESEAYQTKTSVTLTVPMGGYIDFLTLNNSQYMIYTNVLSGIVVSAMETAEAWVDFVKVASTDIDLDKMKFADRLLKEICENMEKSTDEIIDEIIELVIEADDYAALVTDLMGFIGNCGITMEDLFETLSECCNSVAKDLIMNMLDGGIDLALIAVPPAKVIKKFTDAFVASLEYAIVIKDIASMASSSNDFLVIVYPARQIY